jgi:hypothetical protein
MPDSLATLDALIAGFLAGTTPFETLEAQFSPCYLFLPDDAFPGVEAEVWYGVVHERIEWTTAEPSPEQKEFGWMSHAEFRAWLAAAVETRPGHGGIVNRAVGP